MNEIISTLCITKTIAGYIDPATTSYIIQIGAGVAIAAGTFIGIFWSKIKRAFKKKDKVEETVAPADVMQERTDGKDEITAADLLDDDDEN